MRTISLNARQSMYAEHTDDYPIVLVTIQHPDFEDVLRLCSSPLERLNDDPLSYGTISNGETYIFVPISIQLPDDMDERAPGAKLSIENIDREATAFIRSVTTPGTVDLSLIMASTPDIIEVEFPTLDFRSFTLTQDDLTIEVGLDALEREPFPNAVFAPSGFPGLF